MLPDQRVEWLEKFKESDPENALPNYLAAQEAFRAQDYETGIAELRAAVEKEYRDYSADQRGEVTDFYTATGAVDADTALYASSRASALPHLGYLQALSERLIEHQTRLSAAGDDVAAAELNELGWSMLETVNAHRGSNTISSRTMILFMQEKILRSGQNNAGALETLVAERQRVAALGERLRQVFADGAFIDHSQFDGYAHRVHDIGEVEAAEWLLEQIGELPDDSE